jgi:hypothetical protein
VFTDLPARGTELNVVIETRHRAHLEGVLARLEAVGHRVLVKSGGSSGARVSSWAFLDAIKTLSVRLWRK